MANTDNETIETTEPMASGSDPLLTKTPDGSSVKNTCLTQNSGLNERAPVTSPHVGMTQGNRLNVTTQSSAAPSIETDEDWVRLSTRLHDLGNHMETVMGEVRLYSHRPEFHNLLKKSVEHLSGLPLTVMKLLPGEELRLGDMIVVTAPNPTAGQRARVNFSNNRFNKTKLLNH